LSNGENIFASLYIKRSLIKRWKLNIKALKKIFHDKKLRAKKIED